MGECKCLVRQIREYNTNKGEIYAIINIVNKKVYVGETGNGEGRELTHAKNIFGLETGGSNKKLINEKENNSYCLVYLFSFDKEKGKNYWYALETIYMYLFVKYGFELYNFDKDCKKDNVNGRAKLFRNANVSNKEELRNAIIEFLNKEEYNEKVYDINEISKIGEEEIEDSRKFVTWEELIDFAEKVFIKDIKNIFNYDIKEIVSCENPIEMWNEFLESKQKDEKYIILNEMKSETDFYVFNKKKLENLSGKQEIKIKEISLKKILENNQLNKIIYSRVGDYLGESAYKILKNKIEDLNKNIELEFEEEKVHACFWSLSGNQQRWLRNQLSEQGEKDVYMILSYTGSKKLSNKTESGRYVSQYSLDRKKPFYDYPNDNGDKDNGYKTEYISDSKNNMAFLISELYCCSENVTREIIEKSYTALFESKIAESKKINLCNRQKPFYVAELRENDKKSFEQSLKNADTNSNKTGFIVAKLAYPFVVAVDEE